MSTVMPHSELLKRALSYVNDAKQDSPGKHISVILDEAAMRFNLSPADGEALQRLFRPNTGPDSGLDIGPDTEQGPESGTGPEQ